MDARDAILSQFRAALEMIKEAVLHCPEDLWARPVDKNAFWQVAYHALFYTHLYLQPSGQDFTAWGKDRSGANRFDQPCEPYTPAEVMEYWEICRAEAARCVPILDLDAPSGFHWLPMTKLELQFYNIRHLQQHIGELYERLSANGVEDLHWVGSKGD